VVSSAGSFETFSAAARCLFITRSIGVRFRSKPGNVPTRFAISADMWYPSAERSAETPAAKVRPSSESYGYP
jgi:hypothetical protein